MSVSVSVSVMLLRPPPPPPPRSFFFISPLNTSSSYLSTLSLFSTVAGTPTPTPTPTPTSTSTSTSSLSSSLPYGPCLHKGSKPHIIQQQQTYDSDPLINEHDFTRKFNIAALRVPSDHCFALESRLRGHLLNWPRIRNIARVLGDDIDDDVKQLLTCNTKFNNENEGEDGLVSLNRRIYGKSQGDGERLSGVLYRDKLVRTFDAEGFVKFRNLAKLSRPKKRKSKGVVGDKEGRGKRGSVYVVEVDEEESGLEGDELSGLLGDDFKGTKWRGSTRLLLLDERYSDKELDEMPVAIKVFLLIALSMVSVGCVCWDVYGLPVGLLYSKK